MISMLIYGGAFPFLSIPRRSHFSIHRLNYIRQEESSSNDDGSCSGLESAEECLIRRSMADHTDYIYTQDISGP
ncbi:hypothetical protein NC653_026662 [Populus alba x Populus x berolinensis]|uniref:Phytosulfokine n=1 Tax=Populus alba x Populus x berolinensis TaxID=444605 RepID=A0AAD6Q981_9ROSI|nr:hypothetical protein NC653_026662 [Populus alba x Populus x berolinensis]